MQSSHNDSENSHASFREHGFLVWEWHASAGTFAWDKDDLQEELAILKVRGPLFEEGADSLRPIVGRLQEGVKVSLQLQALL